MIRKNSEDKADMRTEDRGHEDKTDKGKTRK